MENDKFVTYVTEKETLEFFSEGLKKAASAARGLAIKQNNQIWARIAISLVELRVYGLQLAHARGLSRQTTLQMLNKREAKTSMILDDKRPATLKVN